VCTQTSDHTPARELLLKIKRERRPRCRESRLPPGHPERTQESTRGPAPTAGSSTRHVHHRSGKRNFQGVRWRRGFTRGAALPPRRCPGWVLVISGAGGPKRGEPRRRRCAQRRAANQTDRRSVTRIGGSHRSSRTASSPSGPHPRLPLRTLPHILSHTMRVHITTRRLRATHMSVPVAPLVHCCMRCARVDAHPYPYARPARPPLRAGGAQLAPCKLRME